MVGMTYERWQKALPNHTELCMLWTASTSRGHSAVTEGTAPVNGGWHSIEWRVLGREDRGREEGDDGEGKGGLGRTRRCGVTVMSARVKWNHC